MANVNNIYRVWHHVGKSCLLTFQRAPTYNAAIAKAEHAWKYHRVRFCRAEWRREDQG